MVLLELGLVGGGKQGLNSKEHRELFGMVETVYILTMMLFIIQVHKFVKPHPN